MTVQRRSTITREIDDTTYTALWVIEGVRKLRQYIVFNGHTEHDSKVYAPGDEEEMACTASFILWQIVTRGWPPASP